MAFRQTDNGEFRGQVVFSNVVLSAGCVTDTAVQAGANIAASKLEQRNRHVYAQESATNAADGAYVVHVNGGAGAIVSVGAGCVVPPTNDATVTVDLLKNGNSCLSAAIEIDSADSARAVVDGTIANTVLAAEDVLEIDITGTAANGALGKGVFVVLDVRENPS